MKIDTNYTYYPGNNNIKYSQKSEIAFGKGYMGLSKVSEKTLEEASDYIALRLHKNSDDIRALLEGSSKKRISFFESLANRYNAMYYYTDESLKESPKIVIQMFNDFKNPHAQHFDAISKFKGSFEQLNEVLKQINSEKTYSVMKKMQESVFGDKPTDSTMMFDILTSPNKKKYISHFSDYIYYFRLNKNNKNAIAKLDKLIDDGEYNKFLYEREYFVSSLMKNFAQLDNMKLLTKEAIMQNYSKAGIDFMNDIADSISPKVELSPDAQADILEMYKTTTYKNGKVRAGLFQYFKNTFSPFYNYDLSTGKVDIVQNNSKENLEKGIHILRNLYARAEADSSAEKFLMKALNDPKNAISFENLETVLSTVPPKKAEIYYDNIQRIFTGSKDKTQRIELLQNEIANPFFETAEMKEHKKVLKHYHLKSDYSLVQKIGMGIKNVFDRLRYTFSIKKPVLDISQPIETKVTPKQIEQVAEKPIQQTVSKPIVTQVQTQNPIIKTPEKTDELTQKLNIVANFKSNRQARKYQVMKDVNDIIKQRLGIKTVEKQQETYEKNATKMRLKLLPEIFDSIKERRATDKLAGKTKGLSANTDAVKLYTMINGRNKKLVNYMLKKRNIDGTRMFEVKDIIELLQKTETQIAKQKAQNSNYKAKDAKLYYDKIHADMINSYGKVKRVKTSAKN